MTTFLDKLKTLPQPAQLAIASGKGMSYSRASRWHECRLKGKFKDIDKLPDPPSEAMRLGTIFDRWSEGNFQEPYGDDLDRGKLEVITKRVDEYAQSLDPALTRQCQFPVYAELGDGYWFYGWLDDMFSDSTGKVVSIEDRKFSGQPWNDTKYKYYHKQAQSYMWGLGQMGIAIPRIFTFRVANLQQPGIQTFTYKPTAKSIAKIHGWLMQAVLMPHGLIKPTGGHHCGFCPFTKNCDEILWGHLTNE